MREQDARYWQEQINKAKDDNKTYFEQADKCQEAYCKGGNYNIFYSNVQTLKAYLLTNTPKPDVERRFIKKAALDKLQYNTFLEVAKVVEAALMYYTDIAGLTQKLKELVETATKTGRGVLWVDYEPVVSTDEYGQEFVSDRKIKIDSLGYKDYLCSTSKDAQSVWWKARRHLLGKEELKNQFNYEAKEDDLNFSSGKDQERKLAEVWEIWDKLSKRRLYILASGGGDFLKEDDDPYGIESFFPCADLTPLTNGKDIIPVPEYQIYKEKAVALDRISAQADALENRIRYVITTDTANQDNVSELASAVEGDIVTMNATNPLAGGAGGAYLGFLPINEAVALAEHREAKKATLKQDIYDITGISDIMRGQTDAQETATAQKIKGVFGSLRFQDKQKRVQDLVVCVFKILAELICEHWDGETLQDITSTFLPTAEEKQAIQNALAQAEIVAQNPQYQQAIQLGQMPAPAQVSEEDKKKLEQPTWEDLLQIMRDDRLRNYTIDIESTATVFDDVAEQNSAIEALNTSFQNIIAVAAQYTSPAVLRGFLPIAKMQLTNIKTGRAVAKQLLEALENAAEELEGKLKSQAGQVAPEVQIKQQELQLQTQKMQMEMQANGQRAQAELLREQNKARELALKERDLMGDMQFDQATISDKTRQTDIKQQEADRKQQELEAQIAFREAELAQQVDINTNIPGDVASLESSRF